MAALILWDWLVCMDGIYLVTSGKFAELNFWNMAFAVHYTLLIMASLVITILIGAEWNPEP